MSSFQRREEDKETDYECGHNSKLVIISSGVISLSHYLAWKDTLGLDGTSEMCYRCYCKQEASK